MNKQITKLSVVSLVVAGSTLIMTSAIADNGMYQGGMYGNASGHPPYTPNTTTNTPTAPIAPPSQGQYHYRTQNPTSYHPYNNRHHGQYNQTRYVNPPPVINGRPQYNYRNAYPARPVYVYDRARDYRYGYLSRPQWYGRMHSHEYRVLHRDGRDFYYLEPAVYSTGVIVGRPQPGVVLMQYPDRTLEIIEATRLILDVIAR